MIVVENLRKSYDNDVIVLKDVSFRIEDNVSFGLIGSSGSGKTTLLNCLVGIEDYDGGFINIDGVDISKLKGKKLREFRRNIGMIFQSFCLLNRKTVYENIAMPMEFWGYSKDAIDEKVQNLSKMVGLEDRLDHRPAELSGGQQQRVAIARALTLEPKYLFCDEATSSLDPKTTNSILDLLEKIKNDLGITIIIVTHQMEVVEKSCDQVGVLSNGYLEASGNVKKMFLKDKKGLLQRFTDREIFFDANDGNVIININLPLTKNKNHILFNMSFQVDQPYRVLDGRKYEFNDEKYLRLVIEVKEENIREFTGFLDKKGVSYILGGGD